MKTTKTTKLSVFLTLPRWLINKIFSKPKYQVEWRYTDENGEWVWNKLPWLYTLEHASKVQPSIGDIWFGRKVNAVQVSMACTYRKIS
jgi:hypothetical protein